MRDSTHSLFDDGRVIPAFVNDSTVSPAELANRGPTVLPSEDCDAIYDRIVKMTRGVGELVVIIQSIWRGNLRWANNIVISTGDTTEHRVEIMHRRNGVAPIGYTTNQFDDASLQHALAQIDYQFKYEERQYEPLPLTGFLQYPSPKIFFDSTANFVASERSRVGRALTAPVKEAGLRAMGYIEVSSAFDAIYNTNGMKAYAKRTNAQYSVTVRNLKDNGSGWAGVDQNDWDRIDAKAITERAQQKCIASAEPRAIEPGRYVTILEPQAVFDLISNATAGAVVDRAMNEGMDIAYHRIRDESKLGDRIMDSRITISSDPMDPGCGYPSFILDGWSAGEPISKTNWITNGVLTSLSYGRSYGIPELGRSLPNPQPGGLRMSGGTATIDEMIATTKRGVLVTRFSHIRVLDGKSLLMTGVTRDGMWLIENGKITYAVKNFRFNESPLFAFNMVEAIGVPVRVFSPRLPAVMPPVKVRDFNFSGLADAL